jgi:hypothetical protein
MGEARQRLLGVEFNGAIRIEGRPERLTADAGAIIVREVDERLGVTKDLASELTDPREPKAVTHPFRELLATSIVLLALGWRDQDDGDALRHDPVLRLTVSQRTGDAPLRTPSQGESVPDGLASQPTRSRLMRALSTEDNRHKLRESLPEVAARRQRAMRGGHRPRHLTIDVDSLPVEVEGHQEGSAYNGHYHCRCFHPLVATSAETGDLLEARLRPGNAHTADGSSEFILPLPERIERLYSVTVSLRCDAGFPDPELLDGLESSRRRYVLRIRNNAVLDRMAEPYLVRPVGRPPQQPRTWFHEMQYRAESWSRPRRVVLVVRERAGELFLHYFWLLTNRTEQQLSGEALLERYRERGTAEGHLGELMNVLAPALSCTTRQKKHYRGRRPKRRTPPGNPFAANEATLLLSCLAYNLLNTARLLMEQRTHQGRSLRRLRERVLKVAARVVLHGRLVVVVLGSAVAATWAVLIRSLSRLRWERPVVET